MVERLPPSVLPDISPTRREIGWAHPLASTPIASQRANNESISPLVGGAKRGSRPVARPRQSGRTEGGDHALSDLRAHPHAH